MLHTLELARRATRLRASAVVSGLLALFAGACNSADNLATDPTVAADLNGNATDSLAKAGSLPTADSLATTDSLAAIDPSFMTAAATRSGIPFGPFGLWAHYDRVNASPARFTASINYTDPYGIVTQINAARAKGQRLLLMMTDDGRAPYMSRGRFDLAKWKRRMDAYRSSAIRNAVARGVADGTVIGNSVIDEPKHRSWGGNIDKAVVDQMCRQVKSIFPTLPVGVVTVHWWRPTERYRVCDFIVAQYDWAQPPHGWGTPGGRGDVASWRDAALAQARKDGIAIAFSMNVLDGGPELAGCPRSKTGGWGTYARHCRMTANQVRDFGLALGPAGCALLMWRFDASFISKTNNLQALRDVAGRLASTQGRSCRRTNNG